MIKKADHWVKVNGEWYGPGQEYDDGKRDPAQKAQEAKPETKPVQKTRARRRK